MPWDTNGTKENVILDIFFFFPRLPLPCFLLSKGPRSRLDYLETHVNSFVAQGVLILKTHSSTSSGPRRLRRWNLAYFILFR